MALRKRTPATVRSEDPTPPLSFVPTRVFFTSGTGMHKLERVALQLAMREAGLADSNLVKISSVIAPGIRRISKEEGLKLLRAGNICFAVIAQGQTEEPHQRVTTGLAWAIPEKEGEPGYIAELEEEMAKGKSHASVEKQVGEEVVELMANRLRAKIDAERIWEKRGRDGTVRIGGTRVHVGSLTAQCVGPEELNGEKRTATAFVAAVYI